MKGRLEFPKPPMPSPAFLKNKAFVKWTKAESCKKDDQIVSTDWHEKLQRTVPFTPAYGNAPLNMVYLLSGEYGRLWLKERDEWYSKVFTFSNKQQDMENRKKKIRKKIRDAKKAAEIKIKERRERREKEEEMKMKLELEKLEKLKAKVHKNTDKKKPTKKHEEGEQPSTGTRVLKPEKSPKVSPSEQQKSECECSLHNKTETDKKEEEVVNKQGPKKEPDDCGTTVCEEFCKQLSGMPQLKDHELGG